MSNSRGDTAARLLAYARDLTHTGCIHTPDPEAQAVAAADLLFAANVLAGEAPPPPKVVRDPLTGSEHYAHCPANPWNAECICNSGGDR